MAQRIECRTVTEEVGGRPTQGSKSNKGVTLEPEMLGGKEICQSEGAGWATEEPRQVFNIEELKEAQMCNLGSFRWG